jgi:uncharacterized protein YPO0396
MATQNETHGGYRLDYLEFYNWGTFDARTSRLTPACRSSLMTGANGSGKTTIVDALLTLLVPSQKRFYNQSSGADQKKDRSEESYILGEIGKTRDDDDLEAKKKYLRPDKQATISFLLGCFHNADTGGYVTLIQVRWFSTTELKRTLIVSPHRLTIDNDILPFDKHGDWKKRLRNNFAKTEITESFSQYSQEFIRLFNMRSEKALTLFNQTVGIKVLGNLNDFIRTHMLEDGEQEKEFESLRANYLDLLETYRSLQKAEEQIRLLTPVIEAFTEYEIQKGELELLQNVKDTLPFYYAEKEIVILDKIIANTKGELRQQEELIHEKESEKKRSEEALRSLQSAIAKNTASEAISKIEGQIEGLEKDKARKTQQSEIYHSIARSLNYPIVTSLQAFENNSRRAVNAIDTVDKNLQQHRDDEIKFSISLQKIRDEIDQKEKELESLRGRKNRIPMDNFNLRRRMLEALELSEEEIPFAAELIKVKDDERAWESAIERLIRNFGLRLLVPEKHIRAVNTYVHQTHLRGKIVYEKALTKSNSGNFQTHYQGITLRDKIDIKDSPAFNNFLENEFARHLNYICAETQEDFSQASKALLVSGLSKSGERHEKDDRPNRVTPDQFILGWDNKEQIRFLEEKLDKLNYAASEIQSEIDQLKKLAKNLELEKEQVQKLLHFASYYDLNWEDDEITIKQLAEKKDKLTRESGLSELIKQRDDAEGIVESLKKATENEIEKKGKLKERIEKLDTTLSELAEFLRTENYESAQKYFSSVHQYIQENQLADPLKHNQQEKRETGEAVDAIMKKKGKENSSTREKIIRLMGAFASPTEEIRQKFPDWSKDTTGLASSLEYAPDFQKLYDRITNDDLPKHKKEFRKYMKDSVTSRITSFKSGLDNRKEEIEEHIDELNKSLRKIDFNTNPNTYIQLRSKNTRDLEIKTFKGELNDCIVPAADIELAQSDDWMETAFLRIRDLIEKLHNDKDKRKKLIDVRNWLDFEAEEFYRENEKRRKTLDSSDSLSGGEKAQFTYTILGAAIAFQFGISENSGKANSFRFIAVDEAFSKLDPEKSHYLMALCRQLDLQILVVTPLDKIYVAEEYISSCHFVERQSTERSKVYNLTMTDYHAKKEQWLKSSSN